MAMRRISTLERSLGQLATSQPSSHICRSCSPGFQRRQMQTTAPQRAKKSLPEGWPTSAAKDPNYIEATRWENLERVGSEAWVEDQHDPYDNYEGWTRLVGKRKFTVEEADEALLPIANEVVASQGQSEVSGGGSSQWLSYKLSTPAVKLGISKLLQQRLGVKISDFDLYRASTLKDIRQTLLMKPESKKLAQDLRDVEGIKELANIKIHSRRVTPIDKEKAVGRWKVIEQELISRGLPVTGKGAQKYQVVDEE